MISAIIIFISSLVFYIFSLAPTVLWGDSAKLTLYVRNFSFGLDLVGAHYLHTIIGKLFSFLPFGDFAWRQNLMSAFFGSAALAVLFLILKELGIKKAPAVLTVCAFGVSHTFWLLSVMNESYTISVFFIAALIWLMLLIGRLNNKMPLFFIFAFLFGLSLNNGLLSLFMAPGILYFFMSKNNRPTAIKYSAPMFLLFIAGYFLIFCTFIRHVPAADTGLILRNISNELKCFARPGIFIKELVRYPAYLFYQFPLFGFFIGLFGIRRLFNKNKGLCAVFLTMFLSFVLFASYYMYQRKFFILLPSYFIFAIFIGAGINYLYKKVPAAVLILCLVILPVGLYSAMPGVCHKFGIDPLKIRTVPYRDNVRFYLFPPKNGEYGARRYALEALNSCKPDAVILADFTCAKPLEYMQEVEGIRKDVIVEGLDRYIFEGDRQNERLLEFIDGKIGSNPVYLADGEPYYGIENISRKYKVVEEGPVYAVR